MNTLTGVDEKVPNSTRVTTHGGQEGKKNRTETGPEVQTFPPC